jgi:hypothetical protein
MNACFGTCVPRSGFPSRQMLHTACPEFIMAGTEESFRTIHASGHPQSSSRSRRTASHWGISAPLFCRQRISNRLSAPIQRHHAQSLSAVAAVFRHRSDCIGGKARQRRRICKRSRSPPRVDMGGSRKPSRCPHKPYISSAMYSQWQQRFLGLHRARRRRILTLAARNDPEHSVGQGPL